MKYDLIAEAYVALLIEGRIDDLKTQNPNLVNEIDSYANQDPTPQKKFVPWLVSQHKKGNVTPDDPSLNQTLSGFETYKSRHKIKDHSSKTYQEIKDAVQPFLGSAANKTELKKKQIHEGIDQIYNSLDNKIQAFHVKTKEASQHVYGGGKHLGGLHTDWCVSARSNKCMFGHYGDMYTIHVKDDPKSPYAVHLDRNSYDRITTRDNNPDEYELNKGLEKFPHLKDAVYTIKFEKIPDFFNKLKNNDPNIGINDINDAARHPNPKVVMAALNHQYSNNNTTLIAAEHPDQEVNMAVLKHPEADFYSADIALRRIKSTKKLFDYIPHENYNPKTPHVSIAISSHPQFNIDKAVVHKNPIIRASVISAIGDWNGRGENPTKLITKLLNDPDENLRKNAIEYYNELKKHHPEDFE